jgi:hypothetical protein
MNDINLEKMNNNVELLNSVFNFREKYDMQDDCILDVLVEYAHKNNLDAELLARELSDLQGFIDVCEIDLVKHKYAKDTTNEDLDDWS